MASAWTRIRRSNQGESRGIRHRLCGARDDDLRILHGLPERIENVARELEHLVEKQNTVVSKAHFARAGMRAATNETRAGNRVVRCAEWAYSAPHAILLEDPRDRVYCNDLERFLFS
jgi:hypothetical protein